MKVPRIFKSLFDRSLNLINGKIPNLTTPNNSSAAEPQRVSLGSNPGAAVLTVNKMSLRQAIRSKFRHDNTSTSTAKVVDTSDRGVGGAGDELSALPHQISPPLTTVTSSSINPVTGYRNFQDDEMCLSHDEIGDESSVLDKQFLSDKSCQLLFESQLNQLQEQLVATMLENQQLSNDLKHLREQLNVDQLSKQLEKEKEKTRFLIEKLQEKEAKEKEAVGSKSPRLRRLVRREKAFEKSRSLDVNNSPSTSTSSSVGGGGVAPNLTPPTPEREEWLMDIALKEETLDEELCLECSSSGVQLVQHHLHHHHHPYSSSTSSSPFPSSALPLTSGGGQTFFPHSPKQQLLDRGWRSRLWTWVHDLCLELVEDFTETVNAEELEEQAAAAHLAADLDKEGDALTVRKLKENIVRFSNATKPVSNAMDVLNSLLRWKSPGSTFLAFFIYMYTVYYGWFLPLFLFLVSCQLMLNYFRHRGWFSVLSVSKKAEPEESDKDMGVSDKFQLVLHVARKVQNQLGHIADCFEKLKSLFLWQQPEVTAHLFFAVSAMFLASCIFPANQLFTAGGLYLGVKCFLVDYVFYLFPRVRQKHDTTLRMWSALPTDAQLEKRHTKAQIDRVSSSANKRNLLIQGSGVSLTGSQHSLTAENQLFCDLFSLPPSETPLTSWHGGRRCTLINKDKSLTSAFKNGRLYLTNSFLCFERSKTANLKNLVLPLKNIKQVEKSKPYPWMPGGGMALEVTLEKPEKTYIFGAILNRDETFEGIMETGRKAGLPWASVNLTQQLTVSSIATSIMASSSTSGSSSGSTSGHCSGATTTTSVGFINTSTCNTVATPIITTVIVPPTPNSTAGGLPPLPGVLAGTGGTNLTTANFDSANVNLSSVNAAMLLVEEANCHNKKVT